MKIVLLLMPLTILISCHDNYPKIDDIEQISPVFKYNENGNIDVNESFCLARNYRHKKGFIGSTTNSIKLPISECDRSIGYAPEEYAYYTTWKISFMKWLMRFN